MIDKIINWRALSKEVTGNPNNVRSTFISKENQLKIDKIMKDLPKMWEEKKKKL